MMRRLAILAAVVSTVCGAVLVKRDIPDENRCLQASKLEEEDLYDPTLRVACQSLVIINARILLRILILVLRLCKIQDCMAKVETTTFLWSKTSCVAAATCDGVSESIVACLTTLMG
jgi:hypothetical protein